MSTLMIEVTPELEQRLQQEAVKRGEPLTVVARTILEERFAIPERDAQKERNQEAIVLLDEWFAVGDAEGEEGDPVEITPLSLREVKLE